MRHVSSLERLLVQGGLSTQGEGFVIDSAAAQKLSNKRLSQRYLPGYSLSLDTAVTEPAAASSSVPAADPSTISSEQWRRLVNRLKARIHGQMRKYTANCTDKGQS